ncbi:hypothetical protein [Streptomyces sp. NPDC093589]|uniref:luciferase domain-containing protein n=1 Tax=Streptomyces sp. NPDC093589 TaxID=3366043 RepID=UPI00382CB948
MVFEHPQDRGGPAAEHQVNHRVDRACLLHRRPQHLGGVPRRRRPGRRRSPVCLHLALDPADHAAFLASGWGEKHPLYDRGVNVVLFYAPRDHAELEVAKKVIAASYRYATGRAPTVSAAGA